MTKYIWVAFSTYNAFLYLEFNWQKKIKNKKKKIYLVKIKNK